MKQSFSTLGNKDISTSNKWKSIWGNKTEFASVLSTMTTIAKALLHTCTLFCIVTAETLNNRTKLANTMNHPLGWYEYCSHISWQSGCLFLRNPTQDQSVREIIGRTDRQANKLCDIMILYHRLPWEF